MNFSAIRSSKKIVLTLVGIAAISLSTASPAFAKPVGTDVPVQLNIVAGGLTLSVNPETAKAGVSLSIDGKGGEITYGDAKTATGSFSYIVDDARGLGEESTWHVNAQVKDFVGPNKETISAKNLTGGSSKVNAIAGVNGTPDVTGEDHVLSDSSTILVSKGLNGAGRFESSLDLSLQIPQYTRPGAYNTVLEISIVTGP